MHLRSQAPIRTVHPAVLMPPPPGTAPARRQRARLWELNGSIHCSIIGTCLTTPELRRVMGKALNADVSRCSDHDLHAQAVGLCGHASPAARLLQKTLDARHDTVVRRLTRLQGEAAVLEAWTAYRQAGDIPGAYWAVLTHPDTTHAGLRQVFGDVHMLSHLVGAANRADIRRLTALEAENAALHEKVAQQQARLQSVVTARDATIRRLEAVAAGQVRARAPQALSDEAADDDALDGLRHLVAELKARLDAEAVGRARLEQRHAEAVRSARQAEAQLRAARDEQDAARLELVALERHLQAPEQGAKQVVPAMTILYVGGRPGAVEQMRALLDAAGGTLLAHDGGRHDHPSLLPGLIGQAALVAFPVDCVSHDAALTVKRQCRQLGKPWAALRSSGLGAFLSLLAERQVAGKAA